MANGNHDIIDRVDHPSGVMLTKPDYYMYPSSKNLYEFITDDGKCIVPFLHVGRRKYGYVSFGGPMDITNMNLDEIVHFRHAEIMIYPDESSRPAVGEGLNRSAQIVLYNVRARHTGHPIDIDQLLKKKYFNMLEQEPKFMNYEARSGTWMFTAKNFSMCDLSENVEGKFRFDYAQRKMKNSVREGQAGTSQPISNISKTLEELHLGTQESEYNADSGCKHTANANKIGQLRPILGSKFYKTSEYSIFEENSEQFNRMMPNIVKLLEGISVESELTLDNGIPTLRVNRSLAYLKKQTKMFNEHARRQSLTGQDTYLSNAWNLCLVLWGPGDNSATSRRKSLSDWVAKCTSDISMEWVTSKRVRLPQSEVFKAIFRLLSFYKILEARKYAVKHKLNVLGYWLSQIDSHETFQQYVQDYIDSWEGKKYISVECKKVFFLLAGVLTQNTINICDGLDWMRTFGLHLWYVAPPDAPIDAVFNLYKETLEKDKYATKPTVSYCDSLFETTEYDLLYHIIGVYADSTYQLCNVLYPETHTGNIRDYRFSWCMLQLFLSLQTGQIRDSEKVYLHTSFANQLERMGEWNWAIFVLLYLDNNVLKKNIIMRLLERHLSVTTSTSEINFLKNLKIPSSWIDEINAKKPCFDRVKNF